MQEETISMLPLSMAKVGETIYPSLIAALAAAESGDTIQMVHTDAQVRNATTDAGAQGLAAYVDIDRNTASRLSVTAIMERLPP